jgi:nucleotide-binding universal stress UspA family protein
MAQDVVRIASKTGLLGKLFAPDKDTARRFIEFFTATEQLENLIPPERRKTLKIKTAVRTGKPYREIIQLAQEAQTDMVSMGVRGRGALDLAVFGSTTYRVMQLGPCPVLTAHV